MLNSLKNEMANGRYTGAKFSGDRMHRYALWRFWNFTEPAVLFIGLNPSRGNEYYHDPTVLRCIQFAKKWGYGGLFFGNLYSKISPDPSNISTRPIDALTDETDLWLDEMVRQTNRVVIAWGSWKWVHFYKPQSFVIDFLRDRYNEINCLGVNKDGSPKHPLYLKKETPFEIFTSTVNTI